MANGKFSVKYTPILSELVPTPKYPEYMLRMVVYAISQIEGSFPLRKIQDWSAQPIPSSRRIAASIPIMKQMGFISALRNLLNLNNDPLAHKTPHAIPYPRPYYLNPRFILNKWRSRARPNIFRMIR